MSDPQRIKGWWHLPAAPDHSLPGVLNWAQETGAELELIGGFSNNPKHEPVREGPWRTDTFLSETIPRTIYGQTDAGKPVTLWNAERGNYSADIWNEIRTESWHTSWVCFGAHVPSADSPVFKGLNATLDSLYYLTEDGRVLTPKWAQIEGVDHPGKELEDGTHLLPYILPVVGGLKAGVSSGSTPESTYYVDTYATRPPATPATEAMPSLKLDMMTKRTRSGPQINVSVGARARVALLDVAATSATDLLARLNPLLGLMSLATFATCGVESMHAKTVAEENVSLLCRLGQPSTPDAPAEAASIVFTFGDVPLDHFLQTRRLLTSGQQAEYAWNIAIGLIGHSPRMVEEHVSQVLAAAEGFHRWCLGESAPTLKQRLILLHGRLPEDVRTSLRLDVDEWASWAAWARNHVAHGGATRHRKLDDFYQLKVIADSVRLVTYLVILQELDVPIAKAKEALLNHPRIRMLADRCGEIANLPDL